MLVNIPASQLEQIIKEEIDQLLFEQNFNRKTGEPMTDKGLKICAQNAGCKEKWLKQDDKGAWRKTTDSELGAAAVKGGAEGINDLKKTMAARAEQEEKERQQDREAFLAKMKKDKERDRYFTNWTMTRMKEDPASIPKLIQLQKFYASLEGEKADAFVQKAGWKG